MYTEKDIIRYENKIISDLKNISDQFIKTQQLDVNEFMKLYEFISRVACVQSSPDVEPVGYGKPPKEKYIINKNRLYPLPYEIGLFGLNTYLYAFFEQIYLIGIPKRATEFDQEYDCPRGFVTHDQGHPDRIHMSMIGQNAQKFQIEKLIYYTIVNDQSITRLEK